MEDDILDSLENLGYTAAGWKDAAAVSAACSQGLSSAPARTLLIWACGELSGLRELEERVSPWTDASAFRVELGGLLAELRCPHADLAGRLDQKEAWLCLLDYLTGELQAARMIAAREQRTLGVGELRLHESSESEPGRDLRRLCAALDFGKPPPGITAQQLFSKLNAKVRERLGTAEFEPLFTAALSPAQWAAAARLSEALGAEFAMRSEMLLKRLDVTIQSFGWSERVRTLEDEMARAYQPRRKLMAQRTPVGLADVLAASTELLHIEKTSGQEVRRHTQSRVNKVLMQGRMPDRGGRPTEIRAPAPEMPSWQKERAQDRGGGGGGGGRGGGGRGGGGRGGSRIQGGWSGGGGGRGGGRGGGGGRRYDPPPQGGGGGGDRQPAPSRYDPPQGGGALYGGGSARHQGQYQYQNQGY